MIWLILVIFWIIIGIVGIIRNKEKIVYLMFLSIPFLAIGLFSSFPTDKEYKEIYSFEEILGTYKTSVVEIKEHKKFFFLDENNNIKELFIDNVKIINPKGDIYILYKKDEAKVRVSFWRLIPNNFVKENLTIEIR